MPQVPSASPATARARRPAPPAPRARPAAEQASLGRARGAGGAEGNGSRAAAGRAHGHAGNDALEFDLDLSASSAASDAPPRGDQAAGFAGARRKGRERVFDFSSGAPKLLDDVGPGEFALDAEHSSAGTVASASDGYLDVKPRIAFVGEAAATEEARLRAKQNIAQARAQFETTPMTFSLVRLLVAVGLAAIAFGLDRSMLHGQASWPWLIVHALALYLVRDALRGKGSLGWDAIVWSACALAVSYAVNWQLTPR